MTSSSNDARQAFTEVVAIEAWHSPFTEGRVQDLSVDVVFGTAPIGEDAASPVRFRLSIRRAEVVVVIPDVEPASVDPTSVSRDTPKLKGVMTTRRSRSAKRSFVAKLFGKLSLTAPAATAAAGAKLEVAASREALVEGQGAIENIAITQSKSEDGHYRWILLPHFEDTLSGRPWDPLAQPRLKLIDERRDVSVGIPPAVRVEVRCRREDMVISELVLKDEGLWESVQGKVGFRNRMAAAESLIRDRLIDDGLEVGDMGELFARLTLASVAAMPLVSR